MNRRGIETVSDRTSYWILGALVLATVIGVLSLGTSGEEYALIVGIGNYRDQDWLRQLRANDDAIAFRDALVQSNHVPEANVRLLVDEHATATAIWEWFQQTRFGQKDLVYIFLAGHGGLVEDPTGEESKLAAFYPFEAELNGGPRNIISENDLKSLIEIYLDHCDVAVFLDVCHSGGIARDSFAASIRGAGVPVSRGLREAVRSPGDLTMVFAACEESGDAMEHEDPSVTPAGCFTRFLISGMTCLGDRDGDGLVSYQELVDYLGEEVPAYAWQTWGRSQIPDCQLSPDNPGTRETPVFAVAPRCGDPAQKEEPEGRLAQTARGSNEDNEVIVLPDPQLEEAARSFLGIPVGEPIRRSWAESLQRLAAPFRGIRSLEGIEAFTNLEYLDVAHNAICNLDALGKLAKLRVLHLEGNPIASLEALSLLKDLEQLDLTACSSIKDISPLSELEALSHLVLSNTHVRDLSPLARIRQLRVLVMGNTGLGDISVVESLSHLEELRLWGNQISDISALSCLSGLQTLDVSHNKLRDISPLVRLQALVVLDASDNEIVDLSPVGELPLLQHLDLSHNLISEISPLANLSGLTSLDLSWNAITDLAPLAGLRRLRSLALWDNRISDISALADLDALVELNLAVNCISDLTPLSSLDQLTLLKIWNNDIVDVTPLGDLRQLTELSLLRNQIEDVSALAGLHQMQRLDLRGNRIIDASPLGALDDLEYIDIDGYAGYRDPGGCYGAEVSESTAPDAYGIRIIAPTAGETLYAGTTYRYYWETTNLIWGRTEMLTVELSLDGGDTWAPFQGVSNDGSNPWVVDNVRSHECMLRITSRRLHNVSGVSGIFRIVPNPHPKRWMEVTSPSSDTTWIAGTANVITWTDQDAGVAIKVEYSWDEGKTWVLLSHGAENSGTYLWSIPVGMDSHQCRIRLTSSEFPGAFATSALFTIAPPDP